MSSRLQQAIEDGLYAAEVAGHVKTTSRVATAKLVMEAMQKDSIGTTVPIDLKNCYECGKFVDPDDGETHGRAGRVHFRCIPGEDQRNTDGL